MFLTAKLHPNKRKKNEVEKMRNLRTSCSAFVMVSRKFWKRVTCSSLKRASFCRSVSANSVVNCQISFISFRTVVHDAGSKHCTTLHGKDWWTGEMPCKPSIWYINRSLWNCKTSSDSGEGSQAPMYCKLAGDVESEIVFLIQTDCCFCESEVLKTRVQNRSANHETNKNS